MSHNQDVEIELKAKVNSFALGEVLQKLSEIRQGIWTQPNSNFVVTVKGEKVEI
jgi:hypothetical protein